MKSKNKPSEPMNVEDSAQPLVTIVVVTYNSAKFVLETLESAKRQSYPNIELIVTDDCSPDDTVEVCKNWLKKHPNSFKKANIITVEKNTGIVGNCNRALHAANGQWIKFIAGDDILVDSCIEDFVTYCDQHPAAKVVFGRAYMLSNNKLVETPLQKIATADPIEQKNIVLTSRPWPGINASTSFFHRTTLSNLGGFDTSYKMLEDLPLWAKYVTNDIQLHFMDTYVTQYRIHQENISGNRSVQYINKKLYTDKKKYILNVLIPYNKKEGNFGFILHFYNYFIVSDIILALGNKNNLLSRILSHLVLRDTFNRFVRENPNSR